jgi:hypothetical protein
LFSTHARSCRDSSSPTGKLSLGVT